MATTDHPSYESQSEAFLGISQPVEHGLIHLLQASRYAQDTDRPLTDFAVEIATLRKRGMSNSDFRWLLCKGYLTQVLDVTPIGKEVRDFRESRGLIFSRRSCFVLTDAGIEFAEQLVHHHTQTDLNLRLLNGSIDPMLQRDGVDRLHALSHGNNGHEPYTLHQMITNSLNGSSAANGGIAEVLLDQSSPKWDVDRQEFYYQSQIVKQFKLPSPNQERILTAFEEEGWPPRIDDPLPRHPDLDPKRRLHDTIKSLNRNQKSRLIRFKGDGKGEGILWEPIDRGRLNGTT